MSQLNEKKTDQILEEVRKRKTLQSVVDVEEEKVKVVTFTLGGNRFAFFGRDVKEILNKSDITFVPGTPDFILGVINVRGDIESVIDILKLFGLPGKNHGNDRYIAIAARDAFRSGILIDTVEDVMDVLPSIIKPPLTTLSGGIKEVVAGEIDSNGHNYILLDVGKLFSTITV